MDRIAASHAFQTGRMVRFIGVSCGVKCDFPVRISRFHPSLPEYYEGTIEKEATHGSKRTETS